MFNKTRTKIQLLKGVMNPIQIVATIGVIIFILMALIGTKIVPYKATAQYPTERLQGPSVKHLLGTDEFGRDIFSRIIVGSRDILALSGSGTAIAILFGLSIGLFTGYKGGVIDEAIMRLMDGIMSFPPLLLGLLLLGMVGPSRMNVILCIGVLFMPPVSRVIRSLTLDLKTKEFIEAAKLRGETIIYILFREILPNTLGALAVEACVRFSYAIFLVASLGFLGLGVPPPSPDWGSMVAEGQDWIETSPGDVLFPALAIAILVVSVSLMSDGLRRIILSNRERDY